MDKKTPIDRLNYSGNLAPVIERICDVFNIGKLNNFSVIETGYEDCNVIIEAEGRKYVAKIFSKKRTKEDIIRYASVMEKALEAGINHPPLLKADKGHLIYTDEKANGTSLVLMRFVDGNTFIELGRGPNEEELKMVIEQAVMISHINYHPSYLFDSWAIPNIKLIFEKVKEFIKPEDVGLVEQAIRRYSEIPVRDLPRCFVHGDLTKANVLKGNDGKIYILDFSVSNWYPRIQEIAVIVANLLYDKDNQATLANRISKVLGEYNKLDPITPEEYKNIYSYSLAGVAMEFLGAHQEKYINDNDTKETEFWLSLGRDGLKRELE